MKIAIIGAGNVGKTLGGRFTENGHEIFYGVPKPKEYEGENIDGKVGTNREAVASAEIVLLAVPFYAVETAVKDCGDLSGKTVIDATNPLTFDGKNLNLTLGFETSGAEKVAEFAKGANVVKCFNQTGFNVMENPQGSMMFICGDDSEANKTVAKLAEEIGFEALEVGDLSKARLLEPLAMLWIHLAGTTDLNRDFIFKIQKI